MSLFGFLNKHHQELHTIGDVLSTAFALLPMTPDDKAKIADAIGSLHEAANNIEASLPLVKEASKVNVDTGALKGLVSELLPGLVAGAVSEALKAAGVVPKPSAAEITVSQPPVQ